MLNAILIKKTKKTPAAHDGSLGILKSGISYSDRSRHWLHFHENLSRLDSLAIGMLALDKMKCFASHLNVSQELDRFLLLAFAAIIDNRREQWKSTRRHLPKISAILIVTHQTGHLQFKKCWLCLIKRLFLERNVR